MADRALAAVVVVLCVVALALAASTLSATGGMERGPGEGSGPGSSDQPRAPQTPSNESATEPLGLSGHWVSILIAVAILLAIPSLFFLDRGRVVGALLAIAFFAAIVGAFWLFAGQPNPQLPVGGALNGSTGMMGGGDMGSADETTAERSRDLPSLLTFGVVGVALVMAGGLVYYASSSVDESVDPQPPDEPATDGTVAVADAVSRAADRLEESEGDPENAVYRAWAEMTTALDVTEPATSTPGEFADAAIAAGMDQARVGQLTDLFEQVRYGHEPVTADHERRAAETLRAIEATHQAVDATAAQPESDADATGESPTAEPQATDSGPRATDSDDGTPPAANGSDRS